MGKSVTGRGPFLYSLKNKKYPKDSLTSLTIETKNNKYLILRWFFRNERGRVGWIFFKFQKKLNLPIVNEKKKFGQFLNSEKLYI